MIAGTVLMATIGHRPWAKARDAVIVAIDSASDEALVAACIDAGASDFVVRPCSSKRLVFSARKALGLELPSRLEDEIEGREELRERNKSLPRAIAIKVTGPAFLRSLDAWAWV
jgi:PleD family two-component response regulator